MRLSELNLLVLIVAPLVLGQGKQEAEGLSFCGPENEQHRITSQREKEPVVAAPRGKALIYFICRQGNGPVKLAINGQWRAVVQKDMYSRIEVDPGLQRLCMAFSGAERRRLRGFTAANTSLYLTAEAGKTYFVEGSGPGGNRFSPVTKTPRPLGEIDETEALKAIAKGRLATFTVESARP